jgi:tetratricopeptide (TPR) repeat protein
MKKIKNRFLLFLLLCCFYKTLFAQPGKEIDSLLLILKTSKEDTGQVNILNSLSRQFYRTANSSLGIEYGQKGLSLATKLHFQNGIVRSYNIIGRHYEYQGNYAEALRNHSVALKLAKEINDKRLIAYCNLLIGGDYEEQGRNHPDTSFRNNVFDEAVKYDFASLKIYKEIGDKLGIANCYISIGVVFLDQGNYAEALKNNIASRNIAEETGYKPFITTTSVNIGDAYMKQGNYSKALENHFIAIRTAKEIGYEKDLSDSYVSVGTIYAWLKEESRAKQFLNDGLSLAKKIGNKEAIIPAYAMLEKLDSISGKWFEAYQHHKLFILYRDSLSNEENTKKILQTQLQYEFEKKEDLLKQKQLITEISLHAQKKQKYFYLTGAVLLALLSFFVFLNFRNQRKANRLMNITHAKEKAELELHSLRAQLNPHFMFNSLNAIQELILKEDFDNSHTYLARFAKLLRMLVENAEKPFIPLQKEMDFLQLYLSLESLRIPDLKFSVQTESSINTDATLIPNMILQPYIENAIWHGLSHRQGNKKLQINISKFNGSVQYDIEDNGVGRKKAAEWKSLYQREHKSKGMELLTKRFKLLSEEYGSDIDTKVTDILNNDEVTGTKVSIMVPELLSNQFRKSMQ